MSNEQVEPPVCNSNSSSNKGLSIEELSEKFNYHYQKFWDKIPKATVIIQDQSTIITASKDLVAGLFLKKKCNEILSLALDLAFYVKRSSTTDGFIYDAVATFVSSLDDEAKVAVAVHLEPKGWYDQWVSKTSPTATTNALEKQFLEGFSEPKKSINISFLGPWLATVLLRLETRHHSSVANKIIKLHKHPHIMYELNGFYVDEKSFQTVEALLKRFGKVSLDEGKRNALYRAMIEICHKEKYDRAIRGILDFTTLQSMFWSGMTLVTLIGNFWQKTQFLKLADIIKILETPDTIKSWETYVHFRSFLSSLSDEEKYYTYYARGFDSTVFNNLTYAENMKLCNYFAVLDDIAKLQKRFTVSDFGPTYKQLISNRTNVELLTNDDFRFCANAADDFELKGAIPGTAFSAVVVVKQYKEAAQEQQKIADEAFKNAQFEQMLADKYRKFVEEVEKGFKLGSTDTAEEFIKSVEKSADIADINIDLNSFEFELSGD